MTCAAGCKAGLLLRAEKTADGGLKGVLMSLNEGDLVPYLVKLDATGKERVVEAKNGMTVMETAIKHNVPGIDADCGGACACATCHVYVDAAFTDKVGKPSAMEQSMLDFAENVQPNSRLSCQIKVRDDLDGLRVTTPESQH